MRQVIVNLPPHTVDLLIDFCRKLTVSCHSRLLRFVSQHGQRRFQTMGEIAGLCDCARHALFAVFE